MSLAEAANQRYPPLNHMSVGSASLEITRFNLGHWAGTLFRIARPVYDAHVLGRVRPALNQRHDMINPHLMHRDESIAQVAGLPVALSNLVPRNVADEDTVLFRAPPGVPVRVESPPHHESPDPFLFCHPLPVSSSHV